jgi:hypothetical protein
LIDKNMDLRSAFHVIIRSIRVIRGISSIVFRNALPNVGALSAHPPDFS